MAAAAPEDHRTIVDDLLARVNLLDAPWRPIGLGELSRRADRIRNLAAAARLLPLARLAAGLRDALAREGAAAAIRPWTDAMREAIGHDAQDEATAGLFLASVGVRLGD